MRNEDLKEVLAEMDREKSWQVQRQNIFDSPVRLYLMLKTLYQNYKKNHELQIMQARIFQISLKSNEHESINSTKVSAASLFQYHDLSQTDILLLIEMKDYLKQDPKEQLYQEILRGIGKQKNVGHYMKCYRTLLNHQFINQDMPLYSLIQEKMIEKLLTLQQLTGNEVKIIGHNLLGLPKIQQPILILISQLYEKVQHLKHFNLLFMIFSTNFPQNPDVLDIKALFRICVPQTLTKIKQLLSTRPDLRPIILQAAQAEAKYKLTTMELTKTSKTVDILNFIVEAVKLQIPIWQQIIEWEHKAAQEPKNILKNSLQSILVAMLKDFKCFSTVVKIIQKITDIDQHSQIGLIFVRQLLKLGSKEYLSHRIIRRFLAIKILKYNSSEEYSKDIFDTNFKFIEVILEMFNFKSNVIIFYQHIFNSEENLRIFDKFLEELAEKMPFKFKEFFNRAIEADTEKNQLFPSAASSMLKLLCDKVSAQMAANITKDLSVLSPSKGLLIILTKLITMFKDKQQILLKSNIVRSLNIMLIRTPKAEINKTFQIQFPGFIKENLQKEVSNIFVNVPDETKEELKKTYDSYVNRKKII